MMSSRPHLPEESPPKVPSPAQSDHRLSLDTTDKKKKKKKEKKRFLLPFGLKLKLTCSCLLLLCFIITIAFWKQVLIGWEIIANPRVTWMGVVTGKEFDIVIKKVETSVCYQDAPKDGALVGRENCKNIVIDEDGYIYKVVDRGGASLSEGYRVKLFCKQEIITGFFVVESVEQDECRVKQVFI